jgi:glycosyltransferase involved in cell wall biosynthesis
LATAGPVASADLLDRVDRFVVESPEGRDQLTQFGIDSTRVSLIFPPVDLQRFRPAAKPRGPYTVLFASSPDRSDWLEARGVPLLLEAAGLRPQYRFRLLWRPWGNSEREVRRLIAERGLANVELLVGRQADMVDQYRMSDVCVAPFLDAERCKPAPNSITESLACGRPVVTSACVGLSGLIQESGAGLVCSNDAVSLADCFDRLNAEWDRYSLGARRLAEQCFDSERFVRAYGDLYGEILGCKAA